MTDPLITQLQSGIVPTYTTGSLPTPDAPLVVYVSDETAGSRFQGFDVTAGTWVALG